MARRKGGFGVLLFVAIFLGLVAAGGTGGMVYFYNQFDALNKVELPKLQEEAKKAKAREDKAVARWNELAPYVLEAKVAKPEEFDGGGDGRKAVEEAVLKPILTHLVKEDTKGDMTIGRGFVEKQKLRLVDVVTALDGEIKTVKAQLQQSRDTTEDLAKKYKSAVEAARTDSDKLRQEVQRLNAELAAEKERLVALQRESDARVAELNAKKDLAEQEQKKNSRERDQQISTLQNDLQRLKDENIRLTSKVPEGGRTEGISRDGEIIGVAQPLGIAWISVGHHQRVERGMRFKVYAMGAAGIPRLKGEVEVRNVDRDSSKVGILSQVSDRDPLVIGDMIANPLYDASATQVFVVCGELERYSKEDLTRLIEENGGKVDLQVSPRTDFLVTGGALEKYENSENYRDAKQLGIRMMSEKELLDYLPHYGER